MAHPFITDAQATQKIQESYNDIVNSIGTGFQGTIKIADTKTEEGIYIPTEAGVYTNAGGLEYAPEGEDEGYLVQFIYDGTEWVKNRVEFKMPEDNEYEDLRLLFDIGNYIDLGIDFNEQVDLTPLPSDSEPDELMYTSSLVMDAEEGESFEVVGYSGVVPRLFAFLDENNKILLKSKGHYTYTEPEIIVAPKGTKKVVFNLRLNVVGFRVSKIIDEKFNYLKGIIHESSKPYANLTYTGINGSYINATNLIDGKLDLTILTDPFNDERQQSLFILNVEEGDSFELKSMGGNSSRLYTFLSEEGYIISQAPANYSGAVDNAIIITTPKGAKKAVIHIRVRAEGNYLYKIIDPKFKYLNENTSEETSQLSIEYGQGGYQGNDGQIRAEGVTELYTKVVHTKLIPIDSNNGLTLSIGEGYVFREYLFDGNKTYLGRDDIPRTKHHLKHDGYVGISIFGNPWGLITPQMRDLKVSQVDDADFKIKLEKDLPKKNDKFYFEEISKLGWDIPEGVIFNSLQDKEALFENTINDLDTHDVSITEIGMDESGTYMMKGYEIKPKKGYKSTIAFTCHVHGDEKINPIGLISIFKEFNNPKSKNNTINWMKENSRFLGVFICSPWGYVNNSRLQSRGVNLNRNFDYRWEENTTDEANRKGNSVVSEAETVNIINFFKPFISEIDFHIDWHDFTSSVCAYAPAGNLFNIYDDGVYKTRKWLEVTNSTTGRDFRVPYTNAAGSAGNQFSDTWGIPSVTSEASRSYWDANNFTEKSKVAKITEMSVNLHVPFLKKLTTIGQNPYYDKIATCALKSEEIAINTMSISEIESKALETLFIKNGDVFTNQVTSSKKILFLAGYNDTEKIANLTLLRAMQEITECIELERNSLVNWMYGNVNVNFAFNIDSQIKVDNLISALNPDLVVYMKSEKELMNNARLELSSGNLVSEHIELNFDYEVISERDDIENSITTDFISVVPNEFYPFSERYGNIVVKWIKAVVNSAVSVSWEKLI